MPYPVKAFQLTVGAPNLVEFNQLPTHLQLLSELRRQMHQQGRVILLAHTYSDFDPPSKLSLKGAYCMTQYVGCRAVKNVMLRRKLRQEYLKEKKLNENPLVV